MSDRLTPTQIEKLKAALRYIFGILVEPMALELAAHGTVIMAMKQIYSDLDASLAAARESPVVRESVRKRFHEPLEKFLQQVSEAALEEETLQQWLQNLRPTDWRN